MNIYIPKEFSEEKCPPERTIIVPSRDKILEEFSDLLEKEGLERPGHLDSFLFINAKAIYVVTSSQPFKYVKLLCEDRPVTEFFWVTDTYPRKEKEEEIQEVIPTKVVKHWSINLDLLKKKMKPIIIVIIVYLLGMFFVKGLVRGPRKFIK
jgi:hypothetical protein